MGRVTKAWNNTLTVFGLSCCSCEVTPDGEERYDVSKPRFAFASAVLVVHMYIVYRLTYHIRIKQEHVGDAVIQTYLDLTGTIFASLIVISAVTNTRNYADVKGKFRLFDRTISVSKDILFKRLIKYVASLTTVYIVSFITDYMVYYNEATDGAWLKFLSAITFQIYNLLSICNFAICLFWLCKSYQLVNDDLTWKAQSMGSWTTLQKKYGFVTKNAVESKNPPTLSFKQRDMSFVSMEEEVMVIERIRFLRTLYHEAFRLSQDVNDLFATRNILIVGNNFVLGTIFVYSGISELVKISNGSRDVTVIELVVHFKWSIICFLSIYGLVWASNTTCNEAQKTAVIMQEFFTKSLSHEIRNELQSFTYQFIHEQVTFTPHGFFTLNNSLILSIIGAVVSYLVVLIQFRITMA